MSHSVLCRCCVDAEVLKGRKRLVDVDKDVQMAVGPVGIIAAQTSSVFRVTQVSITFRTPLSSLQNLVIWGLGMFGHQWPRSADVQTCLYVKQGIANHSVPIPAWVCQTYFFWFKQILLTEHVKINDGVLVNFGPGRSPHFQWNSCATSTLAIGSGWPVKRLNQSIQGHTWTGGVANLWAWMYFLRGWGSVGTGLSDTSGLERRQFVIGFALQQRSKPLLNCTKLLDLGGQRWFSQTYCFM
jgi:hypothetical protein